MHSLVILARSTITNTGETTVQGDIAISPGTAVTGFPPGRHSGQIHRADAVAQSALREGDHLFTELADLPHHLDFSGQNLGNVHLSPGVYHFSSSAFVTGDLVLSGAGRYVFQIASTLITASNARVLLLNGATYDQVFWIVGSSATLGTETSFAGIILAMASITMTTKAKMQGLLYALHGAVTLDTNFIDPLRNEPLS